MRAPTYDPETYHPEQSYAVKQLSRHDIEVAGVVIYVVAMALLFAVALVFMLFGEASVTQAQAQADQTAAPVARGLAETAPIHSQRLQSPALVHA